MKKSGDLASKGTNRDGKKRKGEKILDRRIMTLRGGDARLRVSRFSKRLLSFCIRRKKRKYEGQKRGGCWMEVARGGV